MKVLVVDVGGTRVKVQVSGRDERRQFPSGPTMTAVGMVESVLALTADWDFEAVAIGYPGPVRHGVLLEEPKNLGPGWKCFNFAGAFRRPVKIVNDAAMQAVGSYDGGMMLFLGLGTGLGSAMVVEKCVVPMELSRLPYKNGMSFGDHLARRGLLRLGHSHWQEEVRTVVSLLKAALVADYVVLGGGNTRHLEILPPHTHVVANANAFIGGFRLWEDEIETE